MKPFAIGVLLSIITSTASDAVSADAPQFGTFDVDVVALIRDQRETNGTIEITADRQGYRYLFSTAENRETFLKSPEVYEVQLGGACGKMGELSGRGSTQRHWVYQGHLYVFASDGCRTSFQQHPEAHLDRDDPRPTGSEADLAKGRKLLAMAVEWSGVNTLKPGRGLSAIYESTYEQAGKKLPMSEIIEVRRNGNYLAKDTYNGSGYGREIRDGWALEIRPDGKEDELVPSWKRALIRERARDLGYILNRSEPNSAIAFLKGAEDDVAQVVVYVDGVSSTLFVDNKTGKVMAFETTGRGRGGAIGKVKRTFTGYETVEGVTYPVSWSATFEGSPSKAHSRQGLRLKILT